MLIANRSPYSYFLKNREYPVPSGATLDLDDSLWTSDDELARTVESLDRWNILSVTSVPVNYPRTSAFPDVVNIIGDGPTQSYVDDLVASLSYPHVRTTILGDEQIKALPTSQAQIVPAPGANKAIVPVSVLLYFRRVSGYAGYDPSMVLGTKWASGSIASQMSGLYESQGAISQLLDSGESTMAQMGPTSMPVPPSSPIETGLATEQIVYTAWASNSPLFLKITNGNDLTGGNVGNSLRVTTVYNVIDL